MGAFNRDDMGGGLSATPVSEFYMPSRKKKAKARKAGGMKVTPVSGQDFADMGATPVSEQDFGAPKRRRKATRKPVARVVTSAKRKTKKRREPGMFDFPTAPRW